MVHNSLHFVLRLDSQHCPDIVHAMPHKTGPRRPLMDTFAERVERLENGCWRWTGFIDSQGYGSLSAGPEKIRVHRLSWLLFRGLPFDGLLIDHRCRNRWCANPFHTRLVTHRVNTLENNDCPASKNAKKTHCKYGHPFDTENTYWRKDGRGRMCRRCHVIRQTALNRVKRARSRHYRLDSIRVNAQ